MGVRRRGGRGRRGTHPSHVAVEPHVFADELLGNVLDPHELGELEEVIKPRNLIKRHEAG